MDAELIVRLVMVSVAFFFSGRNLLCGLRVRNAASESHLGRVRDGYLKRKEGREVSGIEEFYFAIAGLIFVGALAMLVFSL